DRPAHRPSDWLRRQRSLPAARDLSFFENNPMTLTVLGDFVTFCAYQAIPAAMVYAYYRTPAERRIHSLRPLVWLYAAFIVLCGLTHIASVINVFRGYY